jgi:predicted nucleic acid-binding protein
MELIQDAQNKQQVRKVLQLVAPLAIIWPTETNCARALSDFTAYHLSHKVGLIYALIAACAVGRSATLCTFNVKHYQVISGLSMEQHYPIRIILEDRTHLPSHLRIEHGATL